MSQTHKGPDRGSTTSTPPGTPRWVKVFGIIFIVLILLVVISLLAGVRHGPGLHTPAGGAGSDTPLIEREVQPAGSGVHTPPMEHGAQQP